MRRKEKARSIMSSIERKEKRQGHHTIDEEEGKKPRTLYYRLEGRGKGAEKGRGGDVI